VRWRKGELQDLLRGLPDAAELHDIAPRRTITIHPCEPSCSEPQRTGRSRLEGQVPGRPPIVERKIAHFTRRQWGGRKARTRGLERVATDLDTRAGAVNWARLAVLGLHHGDNGWAIA